MMPTIIKHYKFYIIWAINNIFLISTMYVGLILGHENVLNIAEWLAWLFAVMGIMALIPDVHEDALRKTMKNYEDANIKVINNSLDMTIDIGVILTFVYFGYIWLPIAFLVGSLSNLFYRTELIKRRDAHFLKCLTKDCS